MVINQNYPEKIGSVVIALQSKKMRIWNPSLKLNKAENYKYLSWKELLEHIA